MTWIDSRTHTHFIHHVCERPVFASFSMSIKLEVAVLIHSTVSQNQITWCIRKEKSLNTIIMHCSWHKTTQWSTMKLIFPRHFNHCIQYINNMHPPVKYSLLALRTILQLVSQINCLKCTLHFFLSIEWDFGGNPFSCIKFKQNHM